MPQLIALLLLLAVFGLYLSIVPFLVMIVWNFVVPAIGGGMITFLQSFALVILVSIIGRLLRGKPVFKITFKKK